MSLHAIFSFFFEQLTAYSIVCALYWLNIATEYNQL